MKKYITIGIFIGLIAVLIVLGKKANAPSVYQKSSDSTVIDTVQYRCDQGRVITATYYEGPEAPEPIPGNPPTPTGSVVVVIDAAEHVLKQTLSASGIRYANSDESLVFWSKGTEALIMRNNEMDLNYTNCKSVQ